MSRQSHSTTPVIDISENSPLTRPLSDSDKPPNTRPLSDGSKPKWMKGSPVAPPALELILLGKTSSGISASGNAILKQDKFKSSPVGQKDAHQCEKCSSVVGKRNVVVVDTPGLYRTGKNVDDTICNIQSYVESNGLNHALYLVVIQIFNDNPFTNEDEMVLDKVSKIAGNGADSRFIVIFTYFGKSHANENLKKYLEKPKLRQFLDKCKNRYVLFQFHGGKIKTQAVDKLFLFVNDVNISPKQHDNALVHDILDNEIDSQETKVRNCIEPNDKQISEVQKLSDELRKTQDGLSAHNDLRREHDELSIEHDNLRMEHEELRTEHGKLRKECDDLRRKHDDLRKDLDDMRKEKDDLKTSQNELNENNDMEMATLRNDLQNARTRFLEFETKCEKKLSDCTLLIIEQKTALNEKYPHKQHVVEDDTKHLVMNEKDIKKNDDRHCVIL